MRLTRIEAVRFGRLESVSVGEFGEALNVVAGRNEAGKTSITNLVRHVLYGFPGKRGGEATYESDAGKRQGRLVFTDENGQWAVERIEGVKGGDVRVHALSGTERPGLVDEVVAGVSRDAFRVAFGFGLAEMAEIETGSADGDGVLSRLCAAQMGLAVSPQDVRARFEDAADALWRPRGSSREINIIKSRIEEIKRELREHERAAVRFQEDRERLHELMLRVEALRSERDRVARRASELATAVEMLESNEARMSEGAEELSAARHEIAAIDARLAEIEVDEKLLEAAPGIEAVLGELSGFRERLDALAQREQELASARSRAAEAVRVTGADADALAGVDISPGMLAELQRWRDRLAGLVSQAESSGRDAARAREKAAVATSAKTEPRARAGAPMISRLVPALIIGIGVLVGVAGGVMGQWLSAGLGASVAVLGLVLLTVSLRPAEPSDAAGWSSDQARQAEMAEAAARSDQDALQTAQTEWRAWLVSSGLNAAGDDPAAVAMVVDALRQRDAALAQASCEEQRCVHDRAACDSYREHFAAVLAPFIPEVAGAATGDIDVLAAKARSMLEATRQAAAERDGALKERAILDAHAVAAQQRHDAAAAESKALFERLGMPDADALALRAAARSAEENAESLRETFDEVAAEHTALETRLDSQARDSSMATFRLELTGLEERREESLERYALYAVAAQLMSRTQAIYERTRQPEVIRRAGELFAEMTGGRYPRVARSQDGGFVAYDAAACALPTSQMSTGTVQQLYLALRIALIETLDDVAPGLPVLMDDVLVNFDPARREAAARAVAELAGHRQVIVMTCHPETVTLLEQVAPGTAVLELQPAQ